MAKFEPVKTESPSAGSASPSGTAVEPVAWFDGRIVPWSELTIHASVLGTAQASACFEGLRAYVAEAPAGLNVFRLHEHLRRLLQSMKILRLHTRFSEHDLELAIADLLSPVPWAEDIYLRILAFEAYDVVGIWPSDATATIMITALPRASTLRTGRTKSCCVSSWRRISDESMPPRVKAAANYLNSRNAYLQAAADGYDDAIMLNHTGHVAESTGACLFMVRDGALITPPVSDSILESITRATLIQLAEEEIGVATVERPIDRTELYIADEIFLSGTGGGEVTPVTAVDRYQVGSGEIGPMTASIQSLYSDVVRGLAPHRSGWLSPIARESAQETARREPAGERR